MNKKTIYALTDYGYDLLLDIADRKPYLLRNFNSELLMGELENRIKENAQEHIQLFSENRKWVPQNSLDAFNEDAVVGPELDAKHAQYLRRALPTITSADMSDRRVLASICCFHISNYVDKRWGLSKLSKSSNLDDQVTFVKLHWLGNKKESNAVARLWWLYEFANRAAEYSKYDTNVLLKKISSNVNFYHQILRRTLIASDRIRAAVLDIAIETGLADRNKTNEVNSTMSQLNRIAGGISLDILSDEELREQVEGALHPK